MLTQLDLFPTVPTAREYAIIGRTAIPRTDGWVSLADWELWRQHKHSASIRDITFAILSDSQIRDAGLNVLRSCPVNPPPVKRAIYRACEVPVSYGI